MGHKILLADDSITIQKVIELTFSDEDFELHTVGNGQKAIDEIRSITPDIVLCDIIMPEKNGYEVCEFIKSNDDLKHIPVLLLTGAFEPFDQERAKAAGCEGFLAKPFEPQTLISKVKELLAAAQGAPAGTPPAVMAPEPMAPPPMPPQPDPVITQSAAPLESDETVLVPPPAGAAPPPPPPVSGPQVPVAPTPPPAPPMEMTPGLDEGFAVEAGERELAMDPGDHTMLLGANEAQEALPPQTPPGAGDDIWNEVASPEVSAQDEDAATVFMAAPPPVVQPDDMDLGVGGTEDPDATWQVPGSDPDTMSSPPPAAPGGDYGGFEDFAAPPTPPPAPIASEPLPPPPPMKAAPARPESPPMAPPNEPAPPADPLTPEAPELGQPYDLAQPPAPPEPIPSVDTEATIDPVLAGADAYPPVTPPQEIPEVPAMTMEPETPFTPVEPPSEPPIQPVDPVQPVQDVQPVHDVQPEAPYEPSPPLRASEPELPASGNADEELVERVAQRVVDKLSSKIIQEIAWEVVPDLAEGLIQREIDALKSKMPKSG